MTPADHAAYAALDLAPGAPWQVVHAAWRDLVKRHHPDNGAGSEHDDLRVREVNAAYAHLCRREAKVDATPGRMVVRRRGILPRRAVWDLIWDPRMWGLWMPGVMHAERVLGTCDQRRSVRGQWGGHRFSIQLLLMSVTPPCRLTARVMELRIDGQQVDLGLPPRVFVNLEVADAGTEVELGFVMAPGHEIPPVFQAAMQAALVELLAVDDPLALLAMPPIDDDLGDWPQAA